MSQAPAKGGLATPLRDHLQSPLSEAAVRRMWRAVGERRARASRPGFGFGAAVLALAGAALFLALLVLPPGRGADGSLAAAGPLTLRGGGEIGLLEAKAGEPPPSAVELSDGSSIELSPGARLSALESTDRAFSALLFEGRALFRVKKGGPRRWSIECGLATVEVVGTHFEIDRSPARVRISVLEGAVLVRGERVPDRVRRLGPGDRLDIEDPHAKGGSPQEAAPDTSAQAPAAPTPAPAPSHRRKGSKTAASTPSPSFRDLARRGDYKGAYRALGASGLRRESLGDDVDALLLIADIARLSGHAEEAAAPLARIVTRRSKDPRASLAAFTLGRLELDSLGKPERAARSFEAALDLGLSEPLIEDARARLVEARARAGDRPGARAAAAEYERRFPNGRRLKDVRRWIGDE